MILLRFLPWFPSETCNGNCFFLSWQWESGKIVALRGGLFSGLSFCVIKFVGVIVNGTLLCWVDLLSLFWNKVGFPVVKLLLLFDFVIQLRCAKSCCLELNYCMVASRALCLFSGTLPTSSSHLVGICCCLICFRGFNCFFLAVCCEVGGKFLVTWSAVRLGSGADHWSWFALVSYWSREVTE